jgi:hypothetical protein
MEPAAGDLLPESLEHRYVAGDCMVLVVAVEYAPQVPSGPLHGVVHLPVKLLPDVLQLLPPSVAIRDAPDFVSPQTVLRTDVLKAQKCKRLRFPFPTLLPVLPGEAPKPDQPGLVFVQFQPVLAQLFP